jgi:hypothetical protein
MTDDINHLPAQTIKDLQANHTYLIRYGTMDTLHSVTILIITDKAYNVRWNKGLESVDTWELKERLYHDYSLVEDISDFVVNKIEPTSTGYLNVNTQLVQCPNCGGTGMVQDLGSTTGLRICPRCYGSKMIPEVINITQRQP